MKTVKEAPEGTKVAYADWKGSVGNVLKSVDKQLEEHGLEVVQIENGGDTYEWYIQPRS